MSSSPSPRKEFTLITGEVMPLIGYGTYRVRGRGLIREVLDYALAAGYRLIDTAIVYENEADIGEALSELLPKYKLKREDIFITSKLPSSLLGNQSNILEAVTTSLSKLKVQYLDLYLIHSPGQRGKSQQDEDIETLRDRTWMTLIEAKNRGWLRNIGVSNYTVKHMTELIDNNHGVLPAVNQVEWHPYCHQDNLIELCRSRKILLQAYFSLGGTDGSHILLSDAKVVKISEKLNKTPAQVLLAWSLQQGVGVIPKSLSKEHIISNFQLNFVIPDEDFQVLSNLPPKRL